jgi:HPt (histidine-containing phosphotransfer) domain-containing protein
MEVPLEIMKNYIQRRRQDLHACHTYFEQQKFSEIEKIAHKLKGSGKSFGHPEISEIGKRLEWAAKKTDIQSIKKILDQFFEWVTKWC